MALDLTAAGSRLEFSSVVADSSYLSVKSVNGHALVGGLSQGLTDVTLVYNDTNYTFHLEIVSEALYTNVSECLSKCVDSLANTRTDQSGAFFTNRVSGLVTYVYVSNSGRAQARIRDAFSNSEFLLYDIGEFTWSLVEEGWRYDAGRTYPQVGITISINSLLTVDKGACVIYNGTTSEATQSTLTSCASLA